MVRGQFFMTRFSIPVLSWVKVDFSSPDVAIRDRLSDSLRPAEQHICGPSVVFLTVGHGFDNIVNTIQSLFHIPCVEGSLGFPLTALIYPERP